MFKKFALVATMFAALFGLSGCYLGTYETSVGYSSYSAVAYYGAHPVIDIDGSADWCTINGAHTHYYAPGDDDFFVVENGRYVFIGDPSYYVSDVYFDTYYYMDTHPLPFGTHWCYIDGPHRHHWAATGSYTYTTVGSYHYYTYSGARNSYYNPNRAHYNLHTHYTSHPPVRYRSGNRVSAGMRNPMPAPPRPTGSTIARPGNPGPVARPVPPSYGGGSSRPNNNNAHPANPGYTHGNNSNVNRPNPNNGSQVSRPVAGNNNNSVSRPSNPGNNAVSRPSNPGNNNSVSRPAANNNSNYGSRPAANNNTVSRPSNPGNNNSVSRPAASSNSNYGSRPAANNNTVSRPATNNSVSRPAASSNSNYGSRPAASSSSSTSRPASSSNSNYGSRPASSSSNRYTSGGRLTNAPSKTQYSSDRDEEENNNRGRGSSSSAPRSRASSGSAFGGSQSRGENSSHRRR